jgi:hypothetical protein
VQYPNGGYLKMHVSKPASHTDVRCAPLQRKSLKIFMTAITTTTTTTTSTVVDFNVGLSGARQISRYSKCIHAFLGLSAKLRTATISFVMCLFLCPHGTNSLSMDGFSSNLIFEYCFKKSIEKIRLSLTRPV